MDMEGELSMETKCNEHGRRIGNGNGNNDGNNNHVLADPLFIMSIWAFSSAAMR